MIQCEIVLLAFINEDAFWYEKKNKNILVALSLTQMDRLMTDRQTGGLSDELTTRLMTGETEREGKERLACACMAKQMDRQFEQTDR